MKGLLYNFRRWWISKGGDRVMVEASAKDDNGEWHNVVMCVPMAGCKCADGINDEKDAIACVKKITLSSPRVEGATNTKECAIVRIPLKRTFDNLPKEDGKKYAKKGADAFPTD